MRGDTSVHVFGRGRARWGRPAALLAFVALAAAACGTSTASSAHSSKTAPAAASATPAAGDAPGVTASTITVGQVDDLSAPVPGLFKSAQSGTQAYFDYINSKGGVNGRRLVLDAHDSAFNTSTVAAAGQSIARRDLAFVGGYSLLDVALKPAIDAGKVPFVQVPLGVDLANDPNTYSPFPSQNDDYVLGPLMYFKQKFPKAITKTAILYAAATPSAVAGFTSMEAAMKHLGYKVVYSRGFGAAETTFLPDVLKMKAAGVQMFFAAVPDNYAATLAQEFAQQNFHPVHVELASYGGQLVSLGGSAANGMYLPMQSALYLGEDAKVVPEVSTFDTWYHHADPHGSIAQWGLDGWASAELFVDALRQAGANPTRASLAAALDKITHFGANGMIAPSDPAHNVPASCWLLAQVRNGKVVRVSPSPPSGYICSPTGLLPTPGWSPLTR